MRPRVRAAGGVACLALAAIVGATTLVTSGDEPDGAAWVAQGAAVPDRPAPAAPVAPAAVPADPTKPPATAKRPAGRLAAAPALQELRRQKPALRVVDGRVRTLSAPPGQALKLPLGTPAGASADTRAGAFVNRYAEVFGLGSGITTQRTRTDRLAGGDTVVRFGQYAGGLPVLGGELIVTVNRDGGILGAAAETAPAAPISTSARTSAAAAQRTAVAAVAADLRADASTLTAGAAKLWLYDPRLVDGEGRAELRPTWWVPVHGPGAQRGDGIGSALIDATDNAVVVVLSEHRHARNRVVCDLANRGVDLNEVGNYWCSADPAGPAITRAEGGAASSVADVNAAYDYLGQTYDWYKNTFGRDSIDGRGTQVRATVRACHAGDTCPYPNAFWDGTQVVFGQGFATDDVVAHEYTHGVTQYTSDLFYAYQSGAINEALSDIMGEFVDLAYGTDGPRWRIGEALPPPSGGGDPALRDMANPNAYSQPAYVQGPYWFSGSADSGGVHYNSGVANKAAHLIADGGTLNGQTVTGIGLAKSAQLWYRVMHLLTSGSGWAELGAALQGGCRQLVGRFGITRADCGQVDAAVTATKMFDLLYNGRTQVVDRCNVNGQQPAVRLWEDDLERDGGWTFDRAVWQVIPSGEIPVSWAHSGRRALYGYMPRAAAAGATGSATMRRPIAIPAGETHLAFHFNVPTYTGTAGGVAVEYNTGSGWQSVSPDAIDPLPAGSLTRGYVTHAYDVSSLAGRSAQFRFRLTRQAGVDREWLVDDVRLYQCVAVPATPRNVTAESSVAGTSATVSWNSPQGGTAVDHYAISVNPPVPGAPTTVAPGGDTTSLTLAGLDATKGYIFKVWAVDAAGGRSLPAELRFSATPPVDCRTAGVRIVNGRPIPRCKTPS